MALAILGAVILVAFIGAVAWLLADGDREPAALPAGTAAVQPTSQAETWTTGASGVSDCACQMEMAGDGSIWIVGWDGIARFDGTQWARIQPPQLMSGEGWPALAASPDGSMWVSGMSFVGRYVDGRWDSVVAAVDAYDVVGAGGEHGPAWFQGIRIGSDGLAYTNLADVDGAIENGVFTPRQEPESADDSGFVPPTDSVGVLATAPDGTVWMGMGDTIAGIDGALLEYDGTALTRHDLGGVSAVAFGADGTGWFLVPEVGPDAWMYGTTQWSAPGLYRLEGDDWYHITQADGLAGYRISSMLAHPDGAIWLSYSDGRVTRYLPGTDPTSGTKVEIAPAPFSDADWPPSLYPPTTLP